MLAGPFGRLVAALLALQVLDRREHRGGLAGAHVRLSAELRQSVVLPLARLLRLPLALLRLLILGLLTGGWIALRLLLLLRIPLPLLVRRLLVLLLMAARAGWASLSPHLLLLRLAQG